MFVDDEMSKMFVDDEKSKMFVNDEKKVKHLFLTGDKK